MQLKYMRLVIVAVFIGIGLLACQNGVGGDGKEAESEGPAFTVRGTGVPGEMMVEWELDEPVAKREFCYYKKGENYDDATKAMTTVFALTSFLLDGLESGTEYWVWLRIVKLDSSVISAKPKLFLVP